MLLFVGCKPPKYAPQNTSSVSVIVQKRGHPDLDVWT